MDLRARKKAIASVQAKNATTIESILFSVVPQRARQQELARTPKEALEEFRSGTLQSQTAPEAIAGLCAYLDSPEE